jgi:hypothetical protein
METATPKDAKKYEKVKKYFRNRYHAGETAEGFKREFDNCSQNPSESVQDYASRLETAFNYAYPADKEQSAGNQAMRLIVLKDRFVAGLESKLQEKLRTALAMKPEDANFSELVRMASRLGIEIVAKERKMIEFTSRERGFSKRTSTAGIRRIRSRCSGGQN